MSHDRSREDEQLRARFGRLRSDLEREGAPDFRTMVERAKNAALLDRSTAPALARRRWFTLSGWAVTAAAAALAGVLLSRRGSDADAEFDRLVAAYASDAAAGAWRSPTDALLEVPGSELIRSVPSIGGIPGLTLPELPDFERVGDSL